MKPSNPPRRIESILIRGEMFDLLPERCAFRRSDKTLLASDLHWGKAETFQNHGLAVPSTVIDDDLLRLSNAIHETKAKRLMILGDLIHTLRGVTPAVSEKIERWRAGHPEVIVQVIRGNHDRRFQWPPLWRVEDIGTEFRDQHFLFTHDEPHMDTEQFVWMGHLHPVVDIRGGGDALRLPCFVIEQNTGILPAFSVFTGGVSIGARASGKRVFAIAETVVIEV